MIKALIFDWHGVLDQTKFEGLVNKLAELKKITPDGVKRLIEPWERDYARGSIEPEKFWNNTKGALSLNDASLFEARDYILQVIPNAKLFRELISLGSLYTLAILSDCPLDKVERIRQTVLLRYFTFTHFSAEKGLLKSDDAFFLNLITEMNVKPEECLYIDDSPKHIATAQRLGFKTCLFNSFEDLEKAL